MSYVSVIFLLHIFISCIVAFGRIMQYTEIVVPSTSKSIPSWAVYDYNVRIDGSISSASYIDDGPLFDPLNFWIPYFQEERLQIYISPNGFLTFSPFNFCYTYCSDLHKGWYPIIALYLIDLNPVSNPTDPRKSKIYFLVTNKTYDGELLEVAIVEYYKIKQYDYEKKSPYFLEAQIELWKNGTILMRYKSVLEKILVSSDVIMFPKTGLFWTKNQFLKTPSPIINSGNMSVIAIRYDPSDNSCMKFATCESCVDALIGNNRKYEPSACTWCDSTSVCVPTGPHLDFCPNVVTQNSCLANGIMPNTLLDVSPFYYDLQIIQRSDPFDDIRDYPEAKSLPVRPGASILVDLPFAFPFFYNPPVFDPKSDFLSRRFIIEPDQSLSILGQQVCFRGIDGLCLNNQYRYTISPFILPLFISDSTSIITLELRKRAPGSPFCPSKINGWCNHALVVQFTNFSVASDSKANGDIIYSDTSVTYQVVVDSRGNITFIYNQIFNSTRYRKREAKKIGEKSDMSVWQYNPFPIIGAFSGAGVSDPSSVIVPWTMLEVNSEVHITPVGGCDNCNDGICNHTSRKCICRDNRAGDRCDRCAKGYYGQHCLPCEPCLNGGTCSDGNDGTGHCRCIAPYSGRHCNDTCGLGEPSVCEPECMYGVCMCGKCLCDTHSGYYGSSCEKWLDPCNRYSLDGCRVCVSVNEASCNFCRSEDKCVSSDTQTTIRNGSSCRYNHILTKDSIDSCRSNSQRGPQSTPLIIAIMAILFFSLCLCTIITLCSLCLCRKKPTNVLVMSAAPGVPNFLFPRREREIVCMTRLEVQKGNKKKAVQGIPLKQIQMKELVVLQRMSKKTARPIGEILAERSKHITPMENT